MTYVIIEIENTLLKNGKTLLLDFYKPFMVIGDIEFLHTNIATTYMQAIEDSYCIAISFEIIKKYYLNDSKFLRFMCGSLEF